MSFIGILTILIFSKEQGGGISLGVNPKLFSKDAYKKMWPFFGFILFFLWIALSVIWSGGEYSEWFHDVQSKLSILGIAMLFALLPKFENFRIVLLHQVFGGTVFIALLLILYVYIPGYEDITLRIGRGRPIPTPIDHVRFSIMVAYSCLSFLGLLIEARRYGLRQKEKIVMGIFSAIFFGFCHLLAVRTGLLLLYLGIFILLLYFIFARKKYLMGAGIFIAVAILPFIAYNTVESFRNKVYYTKYDLQQMLSNKGVNYSDGDRIRSIQQGMQLWKEHPIVGFGAGEYKQATTDFHKISNTQGKVLLPHNQFIRAGMAYGWIGLILLLSGFGFIFINRKTRSNLLLILIAVMLLFSLFVEANLERYYALAFFMLFIGLNSRITQN